ncbi:hypothetical protein CHL76_14280 [Marinococcus halophilus]|uniref:Uncharacterized protein n=1 Tax=Marinococcus halophilus TaxID=1371 RepID=A0A510Y946_MARHA|nr:hypothetical protein [Marinococcus halophilus]OZT79122.1 hypothetical protein CHL76_14280 [Marinococcus halophilus]GEK59894.1 hypothetical protein MHA01_27990 [Marinococcus halophilus]
MFSWKKKFIIISSASAITLSSVAAYLSSTLASGQETPNTHSSEEQSAGALTQEEKEAIDTIYEQEFDTDQDEVVKGKATITLKAAKKAIESNKTKIDNAIDTAIDKTPGLSKSKKSQYKKAITAAGIAKYLGSVTGTFDSAQAATEHYLMNQGVPGWVAKPVVRTIFFIIT